MLCFMIRTSKINLKSVTDFYNSNINKLEYKSKDLHRSYRTIHGVSTLKNRFLHTMIHN